MINVLTQAQEIVRKHWPKNRGWKVFVIISLIILAILGLLGLCVWLLGRFVRSLSVGSVHNTSLYFPARRR